MPKTGVRFLAIVLTALVLIPAGAHFFAFWNKIGLAQDAYFTVQGIYRGWALFGIVIFADLAALLALAWTHRREHWPLLLALLAFAVVAASLVLFFAWIYPANQATVNWTVVPENWETLRAHWEWTHLINAILVFIAFCAATVASLISTR